MKTNKKELLSLIEGMPETEKQNLINQILDMMKQPAAHSNDKNNCSTLVHEHVAGRPDCPHCKAEARLGFVVKRGFDSGVQRYQCKSCGRKFVATTNTTFAHSRKDADTWRKFIRYTIEGKTIAYCAAHCNIAHQTAFAWRHKVLNVFKVNQNGTRMGGRVELDEMFIPISYKGNHVKGPFGKRTRAHGADNGLPRKSFKRGTDNKSKYATDKACVFCMVENGSKAFYGAVPGVGFMTEPMLDKTVGKHINKETALVLADTYKVTQNYLEKNKYRHMSLISNTSDNYHDHKPEIQGENHLQHVNSMHRHIRRFLAGYCGVSTKYLENYISLYVWIRANQAMKQKKRMHSVSISRAASSDCYISWKDLASLPAVPECA